MWNMGISTTKYIVVGINSWEKGPSLSLTLPPTVL